MTRVLKGIAAAPGIAIAPMVHFHSDLDFISTRKFSPDETPDEIQRLEDAVMATSRAILFLRNELSATLSDHDAKIYDVQLALLHDETFKADLGNLQAGTHSLTLGAYNNKKTIDNEMTELFIDSVLLVPRL